MCTLFISSTNMCIKNIPHWVRPTRPCTERRWYSSATGAPTTSLNVGKTKGLVIDFRRTPHTYTQLYINNLHVEYNVFEVLGMHIMDNLTWTLHTSQRTSSIWTFRGSCCKAQLPSRQRSTEGLLGEFSAAPSECGLVTALLRTERPWSLGSLPCLSYIYNALNIVKYTTHPSRALFSSAIR